jgi:beta-alanine--pyruvate transaminase
MRGPEAVIELFHGYTYSGHPTACAAGLATLAIYEREGLLTRAASIAPRFEALLHGLREAPHVIDIRNIGLMGAVELQPRPGSPGARGYEALVKALQKGLLVRMTGDILAFSPPLIVSDAELEKLFGILSEVLNTID